MINLLSKPTVPPKASLVTFDVKNVYVNIPPKEVVDAMSSYFSITHKDQLTDLLLKLIEYILVSNYFVFNDKYYLQTQGAAMGSAFAPNSANIFMGYWEKQYR